MRILGRPGQGSAENLVAREPSLYPSGIPPVDIALNGGIRGGQVILVRSEGPASGRDFRIAFMPVIQSAASLGQGALIVPTTDESPEEVHDALAGVLRDPGGSSRIRILDYAATESKDVWRVPMSPSHKTRKALRLMLEAEKAVRGTPRGRFVEFGAADTLERLSGPEAAQRMLTSGWRRVHEVGNACITWIRSDSPILGAMRDLADVQLVLGRDGPGVYARGERPMVALFRLHG